MTVPFAIRLHSRGILKVTGPDAHRLLQSLCTNDLNLLPPSTNTALSAAFLNSRGRLLHHALLTRPSDETFLLDLHLPHLPFLQTHLTHHRLRARATISDCTPSHQIWAFSTPPPNAPVFEDPRLPALGLRAVLPTSHPPFETPPASTEDHYTRLRVELGVPDGPDLDGLPLPLDLALHLLHGISFRKGCYLGQELTARTFFTGVLRKRLVPLHVATGVLHPGAEVFKHGATKPAARITTASGPAALAVLRLSDAFSDAGLGPATPLFLADGRLLKATRPSWWASRTAEQAHS